MKTLVIAATAPEIQPLLEKCHAVYPGNGNCFAAGERFPGLSFLVTGAGMISTTYFLTRALTVSKFDLCINAGIAGSFRKDIPPGAVVSVCEDRFAELGAEDGDDFISIEELGLGEQVAGNPHLLASGHPLPGMLKQVKGITVNKVHGNEKSIDKVVQQYNPDIESMEGAAFMFTCAKENVKHLQLRGISNFVERRNRDNWNIPLAVKNLNEFLFELISSQG